MSTLALRASPDTSLRARTLVALATVYVVWSSTYLALRQVVAALPPLLTGSLRFALAGAILFTVQRLRGEPWPTARSWRPAAVSGVLLFACGNGILAIAETRVSSGVAAVAFAATPLLVAAITSFAGERPTARELAGIALGLAGVVVLAAGSDLRAAGLRGMLLLVSPLAWAIGTVVARRARPSSAMTFSAQQMVSGAVVMLLMGLALGERMPDAAPPVAWASLAYLTVFGSVVTFPAFGFLVRHARPALATSYAYVNPALAVALGTVVAHEAFASTTLLSLSLVVAAVLIVVTDRRR